MNRLRRVSREQLSEQIRGGQVFERDPAPEGDFDTKVLLSVDRLVYKFFRVRRFFSSNLYSPYALRFAANARRLIEAGLSAPAVRDVFYVEEIRRQVAVYPWIDGVPLRAYLAGSDSTELRRQVLGGLGRFMAKMHHQGILFRSGHLNNYLKSPGNGFALIDVTDVQFFRGSLRHPWRVKSVRLLARRSQDAALVKALGWETFLSNYQEEARTLDGRTIALDQAELT